MTRKGVNSTVTHFDPKNTRDFFGNKLNVEGRGGCRTEVKYGLLGGICFANAFVAVHNAQQLVAKFIFDKGRHITTDLSAVVALIEDKIVPGFMIERAARQALIFNLRQQGE